MTRLFVLRLINYIAWTINITNVTTAEYVAIAVSNTLYCTDFTSVDIYSRLSENITVGITFLLIGLMTITQEVVALAATIDITQHMTIIHLDLGRTIMIDGIQCSHSPSLLGGATANSRNLATAIDTISNETTPNGDSGIIYITIVIITATIDVTTILKSEVVGALRMGIVRPGLIVKLLFVLLIVTIVIITNISIVNGHVSSAIDSTTFTTAIDITQDSRNTFLIAIAIGQRGLILADTNHDMGLAKNIIIA